MTLTSPGARGKTDFAVNRHHEEVAVDVGALWRELRHEVRGEVRFDAAYRAAYSCDSSNYRQAPLGVVCPLDADDVVAAVAVCRAHGAPICARGGWWPIPAGIMPRQSRMPRRCWMCRPPWSSRSMRRRSSSAPSAGWVPGLSPPSLR